MLHIIYDVHNDILHIIYNIHEDMLYAISQIIYIKTCCTYDIVNLTDPGIFWHHLVDYDLKTPEIWGQRD